MREILFRGKRADNNEWIYGYYQKVSHFLGLNHNHFIIDYKQTSYLVIAETIGQYTGLTDKNGKKIFEGDILREYSNDIKDWVVSYDYGKFIGASDNVCEDLYEIHDLEVIGNIYDKEVSE